MANFLRTSLTSNSFLDRITVGSRAPADQQLYDAQKYDKSYGRYVPRRRYVLTKVKRVSNLLPVGMLKGTTTQVWTTPRMGRIGNRTQQVQACILDILRRKT